MSSHSSFHRLFIYLPGLMVTCFLHLSCQSSPQLGMDAQATSMPAPSGDAMSIGSNISLTLACRDKMIDRFCECLKNSEDFFSYYISACNVFKNHPESKKELIPYSKTKLFKDSKCIDKLNNALIDRVKCELRKHKVLDEDKNNKDLKTLIDDTIDYFLPTKENSTNNLNNEPTKEIEREPINSLTLDKNENEMKEKWIEEVIDMLASSIVSSFNDIIDHNKNDFFNTKNWKELRTVEEIKKFIDFSSSVELDSHFKSKLCVIMLKKMFTKMFTKLFYKMES